MHFGKCTGRVFLPRRFVQRRLPVRAIELPFPFSHFHSKGSDSIDLYPFPFLINRTDLLAFDMTSLHTANLYALVSVKVGNDKVGLGKSILFGRMQLYRVVCTLFFGAFFL